MQRIAVKDFYIGELDPLVVISGPCVIESEEHCLRAAETLAAIFREAGIHFIFKCSYDKANRMAHTSFRGPGLEEGLAILAKVKREVGVPILTDIHEVGQVKAASEVCDILQIPALLCRQTDLIEAAARTNKPVNIKKGQFMSPWDMGSTLEKVTHTGNKDVFLTERGTTFGYNNLVVDMRSFDAMKAFGVPVCFDATHAIQLPGGHGSSSGGRREFIAPLSKAALAAGASCLYMESHPDPSSAKSDKDSVIDFKDLPKLLLQLKQLHEMVRGWS